MSEHALQRRHYMAGLVWIVLMGMLYLYFEARERPAARLSAGGELSIPRAPDGHFYVDGEINGVPVNFLVDTGAGSVSVSRDAAARFGLRDGRATRFSTASGTVVGDMYVGVTVSVAGISVEGLSVGAVPGMGTEALLGQNFLRHLDVVIREDALVLRPRRSEP